MPKDDDRNYLSRDEGSSMLLGQFRDETYIKMSQFKTVNDSNYKKFINKHLDIKGELIQLLAELGKVMRFYSVEVAYANGSMLVELASRTNRVSKKELLSCLVVKGQEITSLKNVRGQDQKFRIALDRVISSIKCNHYRRAFLLYMSKKRLANKIYWWAVSCWAVKKHQKAIK